LANVRALILNNYVTEIEEKPLTVPNGLKLRLVIDLLSKSTLNEYVIK